MSRPRLLDLYCGGGGCSVGYSNAGFEVEGVDLAKINHYPFTFHRANALRFPLKGFDAIHASPPCKVHANVRFTSRPTNSVAMFDMHTDLISETRERLIASGLPYVIENVPNAPLRQPAIYCGSSFGLGVRRHRLFEANWPLEAPPCDHASQPNVVGVYGHPGGFDKRSGKPHGLTAEWKVAMGIDWMTSATLSQAIPPAYTEHIGHQLMAHVLERAA